ncbi:MAG: YicC/YloC family endoribonuclease [Planctomycetaceae bacterium]|nr:YicC family protein [Planctomycetaceae bacterium]
MMNSMTGFGAAQGQVCGAEFNVEARSVNNRYLKTLLRLPDAFSALESEVESLLRAKISRGTVQLFVGMKLAGDQAASAVNTAALSAYLDQIKTLEIEANPTLRIDLGAMLLLPGVCQPPELDRLREQSRDGLLKLITAALDQMMTMRRREGEALKADLLRNCSVVEASLAQVSARADVSVKAYQRRLLDRVAELTGQSGITVDAEALAREVAIFAERCDIAEEISRLTAHLDQFRQSMDTPEPVGRKLDFIAQELLREANTIASKAADAEIARAVVDIKTAIDRIKEQVQNIE